jgi:hypothetical protein
MILVRCQWSVVSVRGPDDGRLTKDNGTEFHHVDAEES